MAPLVLLDDISGERVIGKSTTSTKRQKSKINENYLTNRQSTSKTTNLEAILEEGEITSNDEIIPKKKSLKFFKNLGARNPHIYNREKRQ